MPSRYRALLVGNWHFPYDNTNLPDLHGPLNDVSQFAEVLTDPNLGLFLTEDVSIVAERDSRTVLTEMETFFNRATKDEILLLYYSGHGLTADDNGSLLLCARDSRSDAKMATTISSESISRMIDLCPASAVMIVLDCCHSGAFKGGEISGDLAGRGRFVLASSRPRERARDADQSTGMSRFTFQLVEGIRSAGIGRDGWVTLSDLYSYTYAAASTQGCGLPQRKFDGTGEVALARRKTGLSSMNGLTLSKYSIEVRDMELAVSYPPERILVRGVSTWRAETEAPWIDLTAGNGFFSLNFKIISAGMHLANVEVFEPGTGQHATLRVSVLASHSVRPLPQLAKGTPAGPALNIPPISISSALTGAQSAYQAPPPMDWLRVALKSCLWALVVFFGVLLPMIPAMIIEVVLKLPTVPNQLSGGIFGVVFVGALFFGSLWLIIRSWRLCTAYLLALMSLGLTVQAIALLVGGHLAYGVAGLLGWLSVCVGSIRYIIRQHRGQSRVPNA